MHKRTCSRNLNSTNHHNACIPSSHANPRRSADRRFRLATKRRACANGTEINLNFSCDQLDRVDRERTNRDTIAKGEQWGTWRMPEWRENKSTLRASELRDKYTRSIMLKTSIFHDGAKCTTRLPQGYRKCGNIFNSVFRESRCTRKIEFAPKCKVKRKYNRK